MAQRIGGYGIEPINIQEFSHQHFGLENCLPRFSAVSFTPTVIFSHTVVDLQETSTGHEDTAEKRSKELPDKDSGDLRLF